MERVFQLRGVEKRFPTFHLGPVDLELEAGTALGLVGPNGAGKSTTLQCLLGVHTPDAGSVEVFGHFVGPANSRWKRDVGFALTEQGFYEKLSIGANLEFYAATYGRCDEVLRKRMLDRFCLSTKTPVRALSSGDRAKLALVLAMSHRPKLLVLDEPSAHLDPVVRAELVDLLAEFLRGGEHSVLLSSHAITDVAPIADRLAFMVKGKIVATETPDALLDRWRKILVRARTALDETPGVVRVEREGDVHRIVAENGAQALEGLNVRAAEILEVNRMSLEEVVVECLRKAYR